MTDNTDNPYLFAMQIFYPILSKLRFLSQVALLRVVFKALLQVLAW